MIPTNTNDSGLISTYNQANRGSWSKTELEEYLKAGMKKGIERDKLVFAEQKGMEIGKERGIEKNQETTIINGNKNGFTISQLAVLLNISEDKVKAVLNKEGLI